MIYISIAARRSAMGWTQKDLAAKLGVDQSAVAQWENGTCGPRKDRMKQVADVLGITVAELLEDLLESKDEKQ